MSNKIAQLSTGCAIFLLFALCLPAFADIQEDPKVRAKLALLMGQAGSTALYAIRWSVLNEGGNTEEATSASYKLKDAIGQPVIGKCESANYKAYVGFWSPTSLWVVGVEEMQDARGTMQETRLFQNYPNPFNRSTEIRYSCPVSVSERNKNTDTKHGHVSLKIYDLSGRLVKTFDLTNNSTGSDGQSPFNQVVWNGKDDHGREVSNGIYFYKLTTDDFICTKKMLLIR